MVSEQFSFHLIAQCVAHPDWQGERPIPRSALDRAADPRPQGGRQQVRDALAAFTFRSAIPVNAVEDIQVGVAQAQLGGAYEARKCLAIDFSYTRDVCLQCWLPF